MNNITYQADENRYNRGMRYCRAGESGVLLPEISLGLWHNFGEDNAFTTRKQMLHFAFDQGIVHFDLANNYGPPNGSAEETLGKVMKESLMPYRDELFISTKAGHEMWKGPYGEWNSRKNLFNSLHASLKRMNLDYVDLFYSHRYDPHTPLDETLQALVDAVRQGKALYVGISKYPPEAAEYAYNYLKKRNIHCLLYQGRYNILTREPEQQGLLQQAKDHQVGFIAFSPLAQGLLTDRYIDGSIAQGSRMSQNKFLKKEQLTQDVLYKIQQLSFIARERNQSLAEMALAWLLKDKYVCSVIVGASSTEQIKKNLQALKNTSFSQEELQKINTFV